MTMKNSLTYFISERNAIVVVSFVGSLNRSTLCMMPKIIEEIHSRRAKMIIINAHDLIEVEPVAVKPLHELQECIRDLPSELRICFLNPKLKSMLLEMRAIKVDEIKDNLLEAVGSFLSREKKVA